MKSRILLPILLTLWLVPMVVSAADKMPACYSASSQAGLNACAAGEYSKADKELNAVWKAILVKYTDQPEFLAKLKTSQQLWIKFRDAEVDAMYPVSKPGESTDFYGSAYPMCVSRAATWLTEQRIKQLKVWLDGAEEGDVCAGSIKNSADLK